MDDQMLDIDNIFDSDKQNVGVKPNGTLYFGDCHKIIKGKNYISVKHIPEGSIHLIYLDPPYSSDEKYNKLYKGCKTQSVVFDDTWRWNNKSNDEYNELISLNSDISNTIRGLKLILDKSELFAYLVYMAFRLVDLYKLLRPDGVIYLHCDPKAGHYLKIIMDAIFGRKNFRNEIIWHYRGRGMRKSSFQHKHDTIFCYGKMIDVEFNAGDVIVPYDEKHVSRYNKIDKNGRYALIKKGSKYSKVYKKNGIIPDDVWDIPFIHGDKHFGYPTQKPESLLERIILASSKRGDVVLDPFCGGGTTLIVSEKLGRKWIGIDIAYDSIDVVKRRFKKYNQRFVFDHVEGVPVTEEDMDRYFQDIDSLEGRELYEMLMQSQRLGLGLVGAEPEIKMKLGRDGGMDGFRIYGLPGDKELKILYEVKYGKNDMNVKTIRSVNGARIENDAEMAVLITRYYPTTEMKTAAAKTGTYEPTGTLNGGSYPRLQVLSMYDLIGRKVCPIELPGLEDITYKKKKRERIIEDQGRYEISETGISPLNRYI